MDALNAVLSLGDYHRCDGSRNERETNTDDETNKDATCYIFVFLLQLGNWEGMVSDLEFEIWAASGSLEYCFVHELGIQRHNILTRNVHKAGNLELFCLVIGFVHIIRSIPIRIDFVELKLINIVRLLAISLSFCHTFEL